MKKNISKEEPEKHADTVITKAEDQPRDFEPQYLGYKCPKCGSKKTYTTWYIGISSENIQCKNCGNEWFRSPRGIEVKNSKQLKDKTMKKSRREKTCKANKFNSILFAIIEWYCNKINFIVIFVNKKDVPNSLKKTFDIGPDGNVGIQ